MQAFNYWFITVCGGIDLENYSNDYADEYLSILKIADDAFADLVDYFAGVEEPTII